MTNFNLTGDILHRKDIRPVLEQREKTMRAKKGVLKSEILMINNALKSRNWDTQFRIDFIFGSPEGLREKIDQKKQELAALESAIREHQTRVYHVSSWGDVTITVNGVQSRYKL